MKTIKIEIKNRFTGGILFEYECENNTIKKTVEKAIESSANLYNANLRYANLSDANLYNANLYNADLRYANLSDANLYNADLRYANLSDADLYNANLSDANLYNADLYNANLRYANLSNANLYNADLYNADLYNADLSNANLYNADLSDAKNTKETIKLPMYCKWSFGITGDKIHIGCVKRTIKEWDKFFKSDEVIETSRYTEEFKQIEAVYNGLKAYYKHLNK